MYTGVKFAGAMLAVGLAAGCSAETNSTPVRPEVSTSATPDIGKQLDAAYADMPWIDPQLTEAGATLTILPEKLPTLTKAENKKVLGAIALLEAENTKGELKYASGILFKDPTQGVSILTAGHFFSSINPSTLTIRDNKNEYIAPASYESYYNEPTKDEAENTREDMAVIRLQNPAKYAGRALVGRNVEAEPIQPGEALLTRNFQGNHMPGNPASYTIIANESGAVGTDENADGFIGFVGNVMPGKKEDTLVGGGSGSGLIDTEARIVGINTMTSTQEFAYKCGENVEADTPEPLRSDPQNKEATLVLQSETAGADECKPGLILSWARSINKGSFMPKDNEFVATHRVRFVNE